MRKLLVMFSIFCAATTFAMGVTVLFTNGDPIVNATYIEEAGEYVLAPNSYIQLDLEKISLVEYSYQALDVENWIWYDVAGSGHPGDFPGDRLFFPNDLSRIRQVSVVAHKKVPNQVASVGDVKSRY